MKHLFRIFILGMMMLLGMVVSIAQDTDAMRFPPLDNSGKRDMIQALSNGTPRQFAWSPDSQQLAVSASGGTWIYDMSLPNTPAYHLRESILTHHVAYAPHHDIYISYSPLDYCPYGHCEDAQQIFVRDANTHEVLHRIRMGGSFNVAFSHDGELVAVASQGATIRIWRTNSFRENLDKDPLDFSQCQIRTRAEALVARFSHDDAFISYVGWSSRPMMSPGDYSIWFWDTQTCEVYLEVKVFPDDFESYPAPIADMDVYNPNGPYAIIRNFEARRSHIWDVRAKEDLGTLPSEFRENIIWGFTPDNQHLLFHSPATKQVRVWHIATRTTTRIFFADKLIAFDDTSLLKLMNGKVYRVTETDRTLLVDDDKAITNVAPTHDKQWLFLYYEDGSQALWDIATQTHIATWEKPLNNAVISPDKSKMAWIEEGMVYIWDFATAQATPLNNFRNVGCNVMWSETDNTMVTYDGVTECFDYTYRGITLTHRLAVWTLTDTGFEYRWGMADYGDIVHVADDYILLMNDDNLEFWDVQTGEIVHTLIPSACQIPTQTDPFCARWADIQAHQTSILPTISVIEYEDNQIVIENSLHPDETTTYSLPEHIAQQLRASSDNEWRITSQGDVIVRMGEIVYNLTQDTAMRMGDIRTLQRGCRIDCQGFSVLGRWLSRDGLILFGSGWKEGNPFSVTRDSVLTAWDTQTGRNLYVLYGWLDDNIKVSRDGRHVFLLGWETYVGMGKTYYNRHAHVYDVYTGERLLYADTYDDNAYAIDVSPNRRFAVVHSDNSRVWGIVSP